MIKGPQKGDKGDNKEREREDAEAIMVKGPQSEDMGNNKERRCRGYTDQRPAEGGRTTMNKGPSEYKGDKKKEECGIRTRRPMACGLPC